MMAGLQDSFRYFALNSEMRWRALQTGRVYIKHHPSDARLSLDELRSMIDCGGEQFSKRVMHYASSLRGTKQYWFKQRSRLIAMVDMLGMSTVFFTHSAANNQWPELARLICTDNPESSSSRSTAVNQNPVIADWLFYERITNLWKPSMLIFSEPQTIGSDLSGSIGEVRMCMG